MSIFCGSIMLINLFIYVLKLEGFLMLLVGKIDHLEADELYDDKRNMDIDEESMEDMLESVKIEVQQIRMDQERQPLLTEKPKYF